MSEQPLKCFTFLASLPPIQSAITLDGMGDGARIKLDLPRSDADAALLLQAHGAGRPLRITVEVLDGGHDDQAGRAIGRAPAKRRVAKGSNGVQ